MSNPLLTRVKLPGRIFQLPSRGLFYTDGELDESVKEAEIHVHPMTALAEINMKNPDQLFSGKAIDEVFKTCVEGINKPSRLLSKDVDAIIMFLRTVTYGSQYEFIAKHTCKDAKEHSYIADVDVMISRMKMLDPTTLKETFSVTLPNGQVVSLQPSRYDQILELIKNSQNKSEITHEERKKNLLTMLMGVIKSVDEISDPALIEEWVTSIPATWTNRIAEKTEGVNTWGPDTIWEVNCRDCGEKFNVDIPINPVSFFIE